MPTLGGIDVQKNPHLPVGKVAVFQGSECVWFGDLAAMRGRVANFDRIVMNEEDYDRFKAEAERKVAANRNREHMQRWKRGMR